MDPASDQGGRDPPNRPVPSQSPQQAAEPQGRDKSLHNTGHPGILGWILAGAYGELVASQTQNANLINEWMRSTEHEIPPCHTLTGPLLERLSDQADDIACDRTRLITAPSRLGPSPEKTTARQGTIVRVNVQDSMRILAHPGVDERKDIGWHFFLILFESYTHLAVLPVVRWTDNNMWEDFAALPITTEEGLIDLPVALPRGGPLILESDHDRSLWRHVRTRPLISVQLTQMLVLSRYRRRTVIGRVQPESLAVLLGRICEVFP